MKNILNGQTEVLGMKFSLWENGSWRSLSQGSFSTVSGQQMKHY